jgi:hypothetical protein
MQPHVALAGCVKEYQATIRGFFERSHLFRLLVPCLYLTEMGEPDKADRMTTMDDEQGYVQTASRDRGGTNLARSHLAHGDVLIIITCSYLYTRTSDSI